MMTAVANLTSQKRQVVAVKESIRVCLPNEEVVSVIGVRDKISD